MPSFRETSTRVAAAVLGSFMLVAGVMFLFAVLTDVLSGRNLLTAVAQFLFGWWFLSYGLGWHSPFRRINVEARSLPAGDP